MLDLLEENSSAWHKLRAAGLDKHMLCFELVPDRILSSSANLTLYRAKIFGGWLVAVRPHDSLTFVPDPQHEWDGGSLD